MAKQTDFNPVKEDKDGVRAKRTIWSTKSLDLALKGIEQGKKLVANPFYENNKSFDEFKKQLKEQTIQEPNNKITEKEIEATINHSKEILNSFNPYE